MVRFRIKSIRKKTEIETILVDAPPISFVNFNKESSMVLVSVYYLWRKAWKDLFILKTKIELQHNLYRNFAEKCLEVNSAHIENILIIFQLSVKKYQFPNFLVHDHLAVNWLLCLFFLKIYFRQNCKEIWTNVIANIHRG